MQTLRIKYKNDKVTAATSGKGKRAPKGREFSVVKLAHITGERTFFIENPNRDSTRPLLLVIAGRETELRPTVANLRLGHYGETYNPHGRDHNFEFIKKLGYEWLWQKGVGSEGRQVVTAYLPYLSQLDPGMVDDEMVQFLMLLPTWWVAAQQAKLDNEAVAVVIRHLRKLGVMRGGVKREEPLIPMDVFESEIPSLIPTAGYFWAMLDRRTRLPLIPDPAFQVQLYLAMLKGFASLTHSDGTVTSHYDKQRLGVEQYEEVMKELSKRNRYDRWGWARHQGDFAEHGTQDIGLLPAVACNFHHKHFDKFLAAQTKLYFDTQEVVLCLALLPLR